MKIVIETSSAQLRPGLATKWHAQCFELTEGTPSEGELGGPVGEAHHHEKEGAAARHALEDFWRKRA